MPKVTVCIGRDIDAQYKWALKQSSLIISTVAIREMLWNKVTDKLVLSIRDTIMIKCLRSGRNVILIGEHKEIEQIERIDEVLQAQSSIDDSHYSWKAKDFK